MPSEFADSDGWYAILNHVYDELFPPTLLELLEDRRCQLSPQDRRAIFSKKTRAAVVACLDELEKDSHTEDVAQLLLHTNTTFAIVVLEAIQAIMPTADSLEGVMPAPLSGCEAVRFCLSRLA